MKIRLTTMALAAVLALGLIGCGAEADSPEAEPTVEVAAEAETTTPEPTATPDERPGEATVYAEIEAETDCAALQETFDRGFASTERAEAGSMVHEAGLAYMKAADERMKELDCY